MSLQETAVRPQLLRGRDLQIMFVVLGAHQGGARRSVQVLTTTQRCAAKHDSGRACGALNFDWRLFVLGYGR
jgi:hypothetical protein